MPLLKKMCQLTNCPKIQRIWVKAIPRDNIPENSNNTVVCSKHFPPNFPTIKVKGRERSRDLPSIFKDIPKSLIPTKPPSKRKTVKAASSVRTSKEDELSTFLEFDKIESFVDLRDSICTDRVGEGIIHYVSGNALYIQSNELENNTGIAKFVLCIFDDLTFNVYHAGVKISISSMVKNRIHRVNSWSQIAEMLRYLKCLDKNQKQLVLLEQASCLGNVHSNIFQQKYSPEMMVRAFEYFARSGCLYDQLRNDFELPSIATLT